MEEMCAVLLGSRRCAVCLVGFTRCVTGKKDVCLYCRSSGLFERLLGFQWVIDVIIYFPEHAIGRDVCWPAGLQEMCRVL
jgi:hypothetical protein